ncbi:hypothetical protein SDC9_173895 [bioreactor metagenome]|uniref:Uncharacterized protein n=1 Tax=bioreactor metagenome TaxID=1076179 RepID=A0A645GJZ4_9ZZZZ
MDDAAFIVDGASRAILHGLGHVVDVNVIAEHLDGGAVFGRDWRSCEADVGRIRQAVADNPRSAEIHASRLRVHLFL